MQTAIYRRTVQLLAVAGLLLLYVTYRNQELPEFALWHNESVQAFKTMFISIVLEAFPFILLGVLLSSALQVFVPETVIRRLIPRRPLPAIVLASLLGAVFPVCECGMIPVVRRLMQKGMPLYVAVVFILSGPIVNPVTFAATYMAFRSRPEMVYSRMALAFVVSCVIGWLVYRFVRGNQLRSPEPHSHHNDRHDLHRNRHGRLDPDDEQRHRQQAARVQPAHRDDRDGQHGQHHDHRHGNDDHNRGYHDHDRDYHDHDHDYHDHHHGYHDHDRGGNRFTALMSHAADEFFDMGKYLMFGALLTALIQAFLARESLAAIGHGPLSSHLFMMGFAFLLSICSTSDAFVASSFAGIFTGGSLLTFLVFGPMVDLKSTLMMLSVFKTRFVLLLIALISLTVLAGSIAFERLIL